MIAVHYDKSFVSLSPYLFSIFVCLSLDPNASFVIVVGVSVSAT